MDPIIVRRHAGRWAVQEDPETAPLDEYETRELAEVAARDLAAQSGRTVVVHDGPGEPESRKDRGDQAPADGGAPTSDGTDIVVPDDETPREPQAGL
jgi:Uncharacterized protein conserved in bacteria (DUF2188)